MEVKHFSSWILVLASYTSSLLVANLWYTFSTDTDDSSNSKVIIYGKDYGLLYYALALFLWGISGTVLELMSINNNSYDIAITKSYFSSLNNLFLLLGTNHLEFSSKWVKVSRIIRQKIFLYLTGFVFTMSFFFKLSFLNLFYLTLPDFLLSSVTVLFLGISLAKTFWYREFKLVSALSIIILMTLLLTQQLVSLFFHNQDNNFIILLSLYSRLMFIIIICFLAYSLAQTNYKQATIKLSDLGRQINALEEKIKIERETANKDERDSAWQDVAYKAAHKIGNPIDAIDTFAQKTIKRLRVEDIKSARNLLNDMNESIEEAKHVLSEFKSLTKLGEIKFQRTDIMRILFQVCKSLDEEVIEVNVNIVNPLVSTSTLQLTGNTISTKRVVLDDSLEIFIDKAKIKQCFDELVANSLHFFNKDYKKISIQLEYVHEALPSELKKEYKYLKIIYSDNGIGIPTIHKKSIFTPFYTTYQHGTGLGLAIVSRIIEQHEGIIFENGTEHEGAKFEIYLPLNKR